MNILATDNTTEAQIAYLGLRTTLSAAIALALEYRDLKRLQFNDKAAYNNLINLLKTFTKGMTPDELIEDKHKSTLQKMKVDLPAILMQVAKLLCFIPMSQSENFIDDFDKLVEKYTDKWRHTLSS